MTLSLPSILLIGIFSMFGVGLYGLLAVRNLIKVIVALQIVIKAVLLALVLAGSLRGQVNLAQSLGLTVLVADTVVAVIGLALAVQIRRCLGTLDLQALSTLKR
jgi:NADH:ubiquinone oxidoreductase subunit K